MPFLRKMVPVSISGSGFHFIFEFRVLELIENDIDIHSLCWRFFEILGLRVENLNIMQSSYVHFAKKII